MATSKQNKKIPAVRAKENPRHSTKESHGVTGNRKTTERRVGSGNTRTGAIDAKKAAGELGK